MTFIARRHIIIVSWVTTETIIKSNDVFIRRSCQLNDCISTTVWSSIQEIQTHIHMQIASVYFWNVAKILDDRLQLAFRHQLTNTYSIVVILFSVGTAYANYSVHNKQHTIVWFDIGKFISLHPLVFFFVVCMHWDTGKGEVVWIVCTYTKLANRKKRLIQVLVEWVWPVRVTCVLQEQIIPYFVLSSFFHCMSTHHDQNSVSNVVVVFRWNISGQCK